VNPQLHDELAQLCAVYYSGEISEEEWALLQVHMARCKSCHELFLQFGQIHREVVPALAAQAASEPGKSPETWASPIEEAEESLMSRLNSAAAAPARGLVTPGESKSCSSRRARRQPAGQN
jgi:anti-sigma factor RsiW